jgi:hypothetical protein
MKRKTLALTLLFVFVFTFALSMSSALQEARADWPYCNCSYICPGFGWQQGRYVNSVCRADALCYLCVQQ